MPSHDSLDGGSAHINVLEDQRYAAMKTGDLPALERMLANDLIYVHSTGLVHGKTEYLDLLRAGTVRYLDFHRTDSQTRITGECALVSARVKTRLLFSGKELEMENHVTSAWARRPDGWSLIMAQSTPLKDVHR
jgi:ketosteroid isomerase-like protein